MADESIEELQKKIEDLIESNKVYGSIVEKDGERRALAEKRADAAEAEVERLGANAKRWEAAYYEALESAPQVGESPTPVTVHKEVKRLFDREISRAMRFADDAHKAMGGAFAAAGNPLPRPPRMPWDRKWWERLTWWR